MLQVTCLSLLICFSTLINGYPQPLGTFLILLQTSEIKSLSYKLECDCQNGGECVLLPNGEQGCSCEAEFVGDKCEYLRRSTRS